MYLKINPYQAIPVHAVLFTGNTTNFLLILNMISDMNTQVPQTHASKSAI